MIRLLRHIFGLTIREKLPPLRNTLTRSFSLNELDDMAQAIMLTGVAKDPVTARTLMDEYQVESLSELLQVLPRRRKPDWRRKLANYLRSLEGSYASDPYPHMIEEPTYDGRNTRRVGSAGRNSAGSGHPQPPRPGSVAGRSSGTRQPFARRGSS